MNLRHLRYFVAVAEEGHFGRAAERLHIVQPALSMQIRALEDEMGGALFTRTTRRVELTEAGRLLVIEAQRTLAQAQRAKDVVQASLRGEIGTIRLGFVGNAVLTGRLMADLRAFHALYPSALLDLHETPPHTQSEAILSGELDVGYSPHSGFDIDARLTVDPLITSPFVAAMATDHALAKNDWVPLSAIENETLILFGLETSDEGPLGLLRQAGSHPKSILRVSSTLSVLATAAAGMGIALVPAAGEHLQIPHLTYRKIPELSDVADLVLISRAQETSGAVRAFLQLARANRPD
ncbi:MAG TPA: LysR substrate-binding domain-containing protein [Caulobacteraceae bacterium]|nr:LysR substrate-binding domain-containing protein [Caulobacteraceae bacterium]